MSRNFCSTLIVVCFFSVSIAAQDLHYCHYGANEGLPSSQVHDMVQDSYGRIWFSTDQGLSCYDGYTFRNYTMADGLPDNALYKFVQYPDGKTWCYTSNKTVFCFSGKTPKIIPYKYNHILKNLSDRFIPNGLAVQPDGTVFMGVLSGGGYIHIDPKGKVVKNGIEDFPIGLHGCVFLLVGENNTSLFYNGQRNVPQPFSGSWKKMIVSELDNRINSYTKASYLYKNNCAVFTNGTAISIQPQKGKSISIPVAYEPISLRPLTDTSFWVGFRYGGLKIYNLKGQVISSFLQEKSVTGFLIDHEGGYWFSTLHDGVFHARKTEMFIHKAETDERDWVHSLSKDGKGKLWIGYYHGNISVLESGKIKPYYTGKMGKPAFTRTNPNTGEVFLFSDANVISSTQPGKKAYVKSIPIDVEIYGQDSIMMCGYGGFIRFYKGERSVIRVHKRITSLCYYDKKTYLGRGNGLYVYERDTNLRLVLKGLKIGDLEKMGNYLLVATQSTGVWIWKNGKMIQIDRAKGLCDDVVQKVYVENDSVGWVCTNKGLSRFVFRNDRLIGIKNISVNDGLVSNEVTDVVVMRDTVWVGTRQGLCYFPLSLMRSPKKSAVPYYLDIKSLKVNDEKQTDQVHHLPYYRNRIEFNFAGISYIEFSPLQYRYKLQGLDQRWNYTESRSALYASLPPAAYIFILQTRRHNTSWSEPVKYSFVIHPPFWKTWWFIVTVVVLTVLLVYLFFRFRILSYNRDITRELLRQLLKRMNKKTKYVVFREQGKDIRIATDTIAYVKADGNYIEIHTDTKKYVIRYKIGEFLELVPDPLEYLRISRSYIVRIDKVQEKSKKEVTVKGEKIAVGETYLDQLQKIKF